MFDHANEQTFTKIEAAQLIGNTVDTSAGVKAIIKDMFCDGPDSYILIDEKGNFLYKKHNNCPYVSIDKLYYWSFIERSEGSEMEVAGTQGYYTWDAANCACNRERRRFEETGGETYSPLIIAEKI